MTATEFRAALKRLKTSQVDLAKILGVGDRTVRRWALDQTDIPGPVVLHIRLWLKYPGILDEARAMALEAAE